MLNHSTLLRALVTGLAVVFVLSFASTSPAQSGRRARPSTPVPVPTPEPTPAPTPNSPSQKPKPRLTFLVGLDRFNGFANIPSYAYEGVLQSLVDRLEKAPGVEVASAQTDISRTDAIRKAKGEKDGYVVWVQLQIDTMSDSQNSRTPDLVVEYVVFAPATAKPIMSGGAYTRSQRNRGIIPLPRTSSVYGDRYLNQAAQEAADRILAAFHIQAPPIKLP